MDPITLALISSGIQAAAGIGKTAFGASQRARGKRALAQAYEAPTGTPKEYAEMLQQARASEVAQRRIDEINRSMATSTAALQRAGARGVIGGIGAVTEAGARGKTAALTAQQQEIMRALERSTIGAERERSRQINRQIREENLAQAAIQAGTQNIAGGLGDIGMAAISGIEAGSKIKPKEKSSGLSNRDMMLYGGDTGRTFSESGIKDLMAMQSELEELEREEGEFGIAAQGTKVKKTPGAFSHSTNPIDIMKDGAKIGEMTGGEYIFNPKQAKQLVKLSKKGDSELHKFVKTLLNKPQFK